MFVWNSVEMPGVSQEVTEHILNIKPGSRPIKQGLRRFDQEK
jgi:DNA-directed RNA polymerase alpha subunit